jgi:Xaa-Pro aminopeptidase
MSEKSPTTLLYAASESCSRMRYFGQFLAPDAFLAFEHKGKKIAILSALEIARGKKDSAFDEILALEETLTKASKLFPKASPIVAIILWISKAYKIKQFTIPHDFPAGIALKLKALGVKLEVREDPFWPEQMIKSAQEVKSIREGNRLAALGIKTAQAILSQSSVRRQNLIYNGRTLTSVTIREAIEKAIFEAGGLTDSIVAGGEEACDPHARGKGPLRANQLIIVDVFPKVRTTGYYGDMTRTFLKGKPSEAQKKLITTVLKAQKTGIAHTKAGVKGSAIHSTVEKIFLDAGYKTTIHAAIPSGFIHSTGHGVGLDLHEPIHLSKRGTSKLEAGNVVTIEPGLYYPGIGGARIEDTVLVEKSGCTLLSQFSYRWVID